jgi:hypothetical protein
MLTKQLEIYYYNLSNMKKEATLFNHATQSYEICLYTQYQRQA